MLALDLLLPLSLLLFLLPLNPLLSSAASVTWVALQLLAAPADRRWAAWPALFVVMLSSRSWLLNQTTHPASLEDGILFASVLIVASCINPKRLRYLPFLPLLVLPALLFQLGDSPLIADHLIREGRHWTPNFFAGVNQGAYVLGILLLICTAWLFEASVTNWQRILAGASSGLAFVLLIHTGSRAALLSSGLALTVCWLTNYPHRINPWLKALFLASAGVSVLAIKQLIRPSTLGLPGVDVMSDTGRVKIANCFLNIPFSGNNRFLFGVGPQNLSNYCTDPIHGGVADHAHNIYLQIFAASGILALAGLFLILVYLAVCSIKSRDLVDPFLLLCSKLVLVYALLQGFLDLSVLHWPVSIVLTGILVGIPLAPAIPNNASGAGSP